MISHCEEKGYNACIFHYADLLKFLAKKYFNWNGEKDKKGRELLQYLGTDLVRSKNPNFWIEMAYSIIKDVLYKYNIIFIPDARFPNEIEYWREKGLLKASIKVHRCGYDNNLTEEQKKHASETALDNYNFDYSVHARDYSELEKCSKILFKDLFFS